MPSRPFPLGVPTSTRAYQSVPSRPRNELAPHLPELRDALEEQRRFRLEQLDLIGEVPETGAAMDAHDEVALALHAGATAALVDIGKALRRMDTGDYGRCQQCAAAIALERLEILPAAPLCMDCQRRVEARQWVLRNSR